jgi:hypothetical protein
LLAGSRGGRSPFKKLARAGSSKKVEKSRKKGLKRAPVHRLCTGSPFWAFFRLFADFFGSRARQLFKGPPAPLTRQQRCGGAGEVPGNNIKKHEKKGGVSGRLFADVASQDGIRARESGTPRGRRALESRARPAPGNSCAGASYLCKGAEGPRPLTGEAVNRSAIQRCGAALDIRGAYTLRVPLRGTSKIYPITRAHFPILRSYILKK